MASKLGSFLKDIDDIRKRREVDRAERDIRDQLRAAGGLGTIVPQPVTSTGAEAFGFSKDLADIRQVPIEQSKSIQDKRLGLAAAEDKLSTALAPAPARKLSFQKGPSNIFGLDPVSGATVSRQPLTPAAPKAAAPSEKLYVNKTGDRKFVNIRDSKAVKAARAAGFKPHVPGAGKPELTEAKSRKRISQLEISIAKLRAGKGADPLTLLLMRDNPEALAALQSNDVEAAVAAMQSEIKFHERQIPEKSRKKEKDPLGIR